MHNRGNIIIVFDGSFDGFLNIIHAFYYEKILPSDIVCEKFYQRRLSAQYVNIATDPAKAISVVKGINGRISTACYETLFMAFLNANESRYIDLFNYIVAGFKIGRDIDKYSKWEFVLRTHEYAKRVLGESHSYKGFIRFKNTRSGVLYSQIDPENNVLPIVAEHFSSRLIDEKWIIHDTNRCLAAVYDSDEFVIHEVSAKAVVDISEDEEYFQDLWHAFFNQIAIKERTSNKRQRNMLPIRYRKNMSEFRK